MRLGAENRRLTEREATVSLMFDLCQLGLLLYLTGGLGNPFALLLLAPVTISASVLTLRATVLLGLAAS
jgi:two-component system, sensor histidine kinase RegB